MYHGTVIIVWTIAIDTSCCECGFSTMNAIMTAKRSGMASETKESGGRPSRRTLANYMMICLLGPDDPRAWPMRRVYQVWKNKKGRHFSVVLQKLLSADPE